MLTRTPFTRPLAKGIPIQPSNDFMSEPLLFQNVISDYIYFNSSHGSVNTVQSVPYAPGHKNSVDNDDSLFPDSLPLPTGIDIPTDPGVTLKSIVLKYSSEYGFGMTVMLNPLNKSPGIIFSPS